MSFLGFTQTNLPFSSAVPQNYTITGTLSMGSSYQRNKLINGGFYFDQRNSYASVTPTTNGQYVSDRWLVGLTQTGKFSSQTVIGGGPFGPSSSNYLNFISLSSYAPLTSDYFAFGQRVEANMVQDIFFGTSSAKSLTLSFWANSTIAGLYSGCIQNYAGTRSYTFTYNLPITQAWTYVQITIPGDTGGTWVNTGTTGALDVTFNLGCGSNYYATPNVWNTGQYPSASGAVNIIGTSGADFAISCVQLEIGTQATPFETRPYGTELSLCQRYCYSTGGPANTPYAIGFNDSSTLCFALMKFPTTMRAVPTLTSTGSFYFFSPNGNLPSTPSIDLASVDSALIQGAVTGATGGYGNLLIGTGAPSSLTFSAEL